MTTPKPTCAASGTHAGQPWQCERAAVTNGVCMAHLMQRRRGSDPDSFTFAPLRIYEAGAARAELRLYVPAALADGLRARAAADGTSVAALCRPALVRLLDSDDS